MIVVELGSTEAYLFYFSLSFFLSFFLYFNLLIFDGLFYFDFNFTRLFNCDTRARPDYYAMSRTLALTSSTLARLSITHPPLAP